MEISVSAAGKLGIGIPQQRWTDGNGGDASLMQISRFAGQEMMAITDDQRGFELLYLGFKGTGFATMDAAKKAAPEFARSVLGRMTLLVAD